MEKLIWEDHLPGKMGSVAGAASRGGRLLVLLILAGIAAAAILVGNWYLAIFPIGFGWLIAKEFVAPRVKIFDSGIMVKKLWQKDEISRIMLVKGKAWPSSSEIFGSARERTDVPFKLVLDLKDGHTESLQVYSFTELKSALESAGYKFTEKEIWLPSSG